MSDFDKIFHETVKLAKLQKEAQKKLQDSEQRDVKIVGIMMNPESEIDLDEAVAAVDEMLKAASTGEEAGDVGDNNGDPMAHLCSTLVKCGIKYVSKKGELFFTDKVGGDYKVVEDIRINKYRITMRNFKTDNGYHMIDDGEFLSTLAHYLVSETLFLNTSIDSFSDLVEETVTYLNARLEKHAIDADFSYTFDRVTGKIEFKVGQEMTETHIDVIIQKSGHVLVQYDNCPRTLASANVLTIIKMAATDLCGLNRILLENNPKIFSQ